MGAFAKFTTIAAAARAMTGIQESGWSARVANYDPYEGYDELAELMMMTWNGYGKGDWSKGWSKGEKGKPGKGLDDWMYWGMPRQWQPPESQKEEGPPSDNLHV